MADDCGAASQAPLDRFRDKLHTYRRRTGFLQKDLAQALGLDHHVLSRKLHGLSGSRLTHHEAKQIVKVLAQWEAITTQAEAVELLSLMQLKQTSFSTEEWDSEPLNSLERTPRDAAAPTLSADRSLTDFGQYHGSTNLPLSVTSFVGRACELAEIQQLLSTARLLTLTGPGGCGKTRLALEVGSRIQRRFPDGVWLVELAPAGEQALVVKLVASVLRVPERRGEDLLQTLIDVLHSKHLLLILDNCEHLLDAAAHLASDLIRRCPNVSLLATSREPLRIAGEWTYRVPPLSIPGPNEACSVERLSQFDAVRLFCERSRAVRPGFAMTNQNASAIAEIAACLDGMPLAIELAAARVRVMPVEEVADRIGDQLRLLKGGDRTVLPRHQTLRALIDWSFDLLSEEERVVFCRLAVFVGGWTLAAAEEVCQGEGIARDDVLEVLMRLVEKSLVEVEESPVETRYRFLETIRQYSVERLAEAGDVAAVRRRHLGWFRQLAEDAEPRLWGTDQLYWLGRLQQEYDNLRAALRWAQETDGEALLRLVSALWPFWRLHSQVQEGREWLQRALQLASGSDATRVRAGYGAAFLAWRQGDYARATQLAADSLALAQTIGDKLGMAWALGVLGQVAQDQGDWPRAQRLHEESLALFRAADDRWGIAARLLSLGYVATCQGDVGRARPLMDESLAIFREVGDRWGMTHALLILAGPETVAGNFQRAGLLLEESLAVRRQLGDRQGIAEVLLSLGNLVQRQGDLQRAVGLIEESLALSRDTGDRFGLFNALEGLGTVYLFSGDLVRAEAIARECTTLAEQQEDRQGRARALTLLGRVRYHQSELESARTLLMESVALWRERDTHRHRLAVSLCSLGWVLLDLGENELSHRHFMESLTLHREIGARAEVAESLEGLAGVAAARRQGACAVRLSAAAGALRDSVGVARPPSCHRRWEKFMGFLASQLDEGSFASAWIEGQSHPWEDVLLTTPHF